MAILPRFPEKIDVFQPKQPQLMFRGKIPIQELLEYIRALLVKRGFEVSMSKYKIKGSSGKLGEMEVKIEGERKELEFIKYKITIEIRVESGKVLEMESENMYKTVDSQIEIKISGEMELDYDKKYDPKNKMKDFLGRVYWLYMKKSILFRADSYWYECLGILNELKKKLNIKLTKTAY
ncbi:hypothetical protein J7K74_00350 [Candidatus Woesearchaeota archaeon]|nr:hypothetical protein [Candidatus Woesearchaeota archaeon]